MEIFIFTQIKWVKFMSGKKRKFKKRRELDMDSVFPHKMAKRENEYARNVRIMQRMLVDHFPKRNERKEYIEALINYLESADSILN